jgi:PhnB protein
MAKLSIYLNFAGQAEEAFNFYIFVFGGEFSALVRFKDMPMKGVKMPREEENEIMHVALPIGKTDVLMASDTPKSLGRKLVPGNNAYISAQLESKEEAGRIFKALSAGGKVEMPIADQPWGDDYGSFADKFGINWMVSYTYPKKS